MTCAPTTGGALRLCGVGGVSGLPRGHAYARAGAHMQVRAGAGSVPAQPHNRRAAPIVRAPVGAPTPHRSSVPAPSARTFFTSRSSKKRIEVEAQPGALPLAALARGVADRPSPSISAAFFIRCHGCGCGCLGSRGTASLAS